MSIHARLRRLEAATTAGCSLCHEWPNVRPGALAELPDFCPRCDRFLDGVVPAFLATFDPGRRALAAFSDEQLMTAIRVVSRCFKAGYDEDEPIDPEDRGGILYRPGGSQPLGTPEEWELFLRVDAALNGARDAETTPHRAGER